MIDDDPLMPEILAANDRFYQAMAQADLAMMEELWQHSPTVECVHPGWDRLRGWPVIRQSWADIFEHQGPLQVQSGDPLVHRRGDLAWVTCYENITLQEGADLQVSQMLATNIFERVDGRWQMVVHHASPAPPQVIRPRTWQVSLN